MTLTCRYSPISAAVLKSIALLLLLLSPAVLRAQNDDEFDSYKVRFSTYWFYSDPTGNVKGHADSVPVDFSKDLGFNSTFSGEVDWKFTHKNHSTL